MLEKGRGTQPGDSVMIKGEQVEYNRFLEANEASALTTRLRLSDSECCLGITKAALATESFISAASFQETTRVLTEAAVTGKRDLPTWIEGKRDCWSADSGWDWSDIP